VDGAAIFVGLTAHINWLGRRPPPAPGAQSRFIKRTGWTLAMTGHDDSTINIVVIIIILYSLRHAEDNYGYVH